MKNRASVVKAFLGLAALVSLIGCSHAVQKLTVADAENAGFERDQYQFYQMIGAEDGWDGTWANASVEQYQYANEEAAQQESAPEKKETDEAMDEGPIDVDAE